MQKKLTVHQFINSSIIYYLFPLLFLLLTACGATPLHPKSSAPQRHNEVGALTLRDVAPDVGLTFQHGAFRKSISEDPAAMMGGGLCWLDFDGDGWLDLYAVNSHAKNEADLANLPRNALFHNQGDGTFTDVSASSKTDLVMRGNGCIAGDIDQDGDSDIYITADGPNALLLNQGNDTFIEAATMAGVDAPEWNTAAAMGDLDGDGLIDLYVASYIDLNKTVAKPIGLFPQDYLGLPDHLYRNRGDGTFEDIAISAGLTHEERGLGAILSDLDLDGDLDLYVANDGNPNRLYRNLGHATFEDISFQAGVNDRGSGMGVAAGDYDGNGWQDLVVTNFDKEYNALYQYDDKSADELAFIYSTFRMGIQGFGQNQTGWGAAWLDLDLDADLDLVTAQGKVPITDLTTDAEPIRLYTNRADGTFRDASRQYGLPDVGPRLARGMAVADYDNDGDLDMAIASIGGPITLLQTEGTAGNWLMVSLNRFSPGTRIEATLANGQMLARELHTGSSYLASEDPRLHFGLGETSEVKQLDIILPDGQTLRFDNIQANQIIQIYF